MSSTIVYDRSYSERLNDAFWSEIVGIFLFFSSIVFIWMCEKAAVRFTLIFNRCYEACRVLPDASYVNPSFEKRPVLVRGETDAQGQTVVDTDTGFTATEAPGGIVVRLRRKVEMFQHVRHERKEEKRTVVTFTQEWREHDQGSYASEGHPNPPRDPPLQSTTFNNATTRVGAFTLSAAQLEMLTLFKLCAVPAVPPLLLSTYSHTYPHVERGIATHHGHGGGDLKHDEACFSSVLESQRTDGADLLVFNGSAAAPSIGTVRMNYDYVAERGPVTMVGVQTGATFRPFFEADAHHGRGNVCASLLGGGSGGTMPDARDPFVVDPEAGGDAADVSLEPSADCSGVAGCLETLAGLGVGDRVLLLEERHTDLRTIFGDEQKKFTTRLWTMRTVGMLVLCLSIYMMLSPIATVLSFLPFVPTLLRYGFFAVALILGIVLSWLVSSAAWIAYHPEYLAALLLSGGGVCLHFGATPTALLLGQVMLAASVVPAVMWVLAVLEHRRFSEYQRELDQKTGPIAFPVPAGTAPPLRESTPLLKK